MAAELVLEKINPTLERIAHTLEGVERAMYGEKRGGFTGLVERQADEEKARAVADAEIRARIDAEVSAIRRDLDGLTKRFDRIVWIAFGVGLGAGGGSAWVVQALTGG